MSSTNAFGECFANVFDDFNCEVGIMHPVSYREELRSRNKIFDFPITK